MARRASLHSAAKLGADVQHTVPKDTEVLGQAPAGTSTEVLLEAGA